MKKILFVITFAALLTGLVFSAGCVGSTTSDIVIANSTVGKITLNPVSDFFSSDKSLADKVNMKVEIFGMTFTKNGVSSSDALNIANLLGSGDLSALGSFTSSSAGENKDLENILGSLLKQAGASNALSNSTGSGISSSIDLSKVPDHLQTAGTNFENLVNGLGELMK